MSEEIVFNYNECAYDDVIVRKELRRPALQYTTANGEEVRQLSYSLYNLISHTLLVSYRVEEERG